MHQALAKFEHAALHGPANAAFCSPTTNDAGLVAYKTAVLLDAPLQLTAKALQFSWRRVRGRRDVAEKSRLAMRG